MAYAKTTVVRISHNALGGDILEGLSKAAAQPREVALTLARFFDRIACGIDAADVSITLNGTVGAQATGTLTMASSSGTVGGTIAGTAVTVTWATSDTLSAAALATAINANATVNKLVRATSALGVVTLTALAAGIVGNQITLVASGTNVTASGAKLTGGAGDDVA